LEDHEKLLKIIGKLYNHVFIEEIVIIYEFNIFYIVAI